MTEAVILALIAIAASVISSLITWALARKKYRVETQSLEIDNMRKIAAEWKQTAIEWKELADEYQKKFKAATQELEDFRETTRKEFDELNTEIRKLRRSLSSAEKKIGEIIHE